MGTKLIIGIDFGMTFTGVAYNTKSPQPRTPPTQVIKKYPGREGKVEDKVPTILTYTSNHLTSPPSSWGFRSTDDKSRSPTKRTVEWFKLFLDPKVIDLIASAAPQDRGGGEVIRMEQAKKWYTDYLSELYQHIRTHLGRTQKREVWESGQVEFIFSVPTTWTRHEVVENYREVIRAAGFGSEGPNHYVEIGLTEAEAAAVYTSKDAQHSYKQGDNIIVCDAGGGTTDLAALEVASNPGDICVLNQLDTVHGADVGSTKIDEAFFALVQSRLSLIRSSVDPEAARLMMRGEFQYLKTAFGAPDTKRLDFFYLEVPGLSRSIEHPGARVSDGQMKFTQDDLKALFDGQLIRIYELVDKQLARMYQRYPDRQINYLVLSGGLGSSQYIQEGLRSRYENTRVGQSRHPNAQNMEILMADEPQLAVAKGLVIDRIQKLTFNKAVMGDKCCRANYGILCKELYNPAIHLGMDVDKDEHDGKLYALNQIDWFVRKNAPVSEDRPIEHKFTRKIVRRDGNKDYLRVPWTSSIVTSDYDAASLPKSGNQPGVTHLCNVRSDLTRIPLTHFKKKNRHFYNHGKPYYRASYSIKCVIGSADLRFEVWMDNVKYSSDRDGVVKVQYFAAEKGVGSGAAGLDMGDERGLK